MEGAPEITHTFVVPLSESIDFEISGDSLIVTVTDAGEFHELVRDLGAVASRLIAL